MRETIQSKLNELEDIECGEPIADDIIEDGKTYFGYQINKSYINSDMERNYTYRLSMIGYISRRKISTENTTKIVDEAAEEIIEKLKELNFKCNLEDVSIENNIKKIKISGHVEFNEINNKLII